ncbi:MAG: cupin domain-containing protein [Clostridia bacterium]|nr:cupin domain-containing protein [Clostridia bacterium]
MDNKNLNGDLAAYAKTLMFPVGAPNDAYAQYFKGQSYLAPVSREQVFIANVTFEPKCRNNWHIHHAENGGGQILICVGGEGYYQEWGKPAVKMHAGDVINIPAGVKHWHGAGKDKWFSHLAVEVPAENGRTEWCEPVPDEQYNAAIKE